MSTVHEIDSKRVLLTKGAPDELLSRATKIWKNGQSFDMTEEDREQILSQNKAYAKEALRVIGYAMRDIYENEKAVDSENNLTFLGLSGMIDPPREEAIKAIKICRNAGIRVVMITGDHITTASAIAMRMGIIETDTAGIEGSAINGLSESELIELLKTKNVFARV
jgi:Ca2+-transporting ATPase